MSLRTPTLDTRLRWRLAPAALAIAALVAVPLIADEPKASEDQPQAEEAAEEQAADEKQPKGEQAAKDAATDEKKDEKKAWKPAVDPKELSAESKRGLAWLVEHQHEDGGWSQGEEAQSQGNRITGELTEKSNVADTCAATLALLRSGSTASEGPYKQNIEKAIKYIIKSAMNSESDSIYVTDIKGTRLQSKLGPYVDTFLAALVLSEVQNTMPDKTGNQHAKDALERVIRKMEKNQNEDGTFAGKGGWAGTLSQGLASKAYNRAAQNGIEVDEKVRERAEKNARAKFDGQKVAGDGSAGIELYARGAQIAGVQDSVNTNAIRKSELKKQAKEAPQAAVRQQAEQKLKDFDAAEEELGDAKQALIQRLDDKNFIAGFGSNGGEEFLSYMMIGESLVVDGGDEWKTWDKSITENLNRIQNKDGSWSGHHCITGRTFCTSAALLVLMTDRAPVPLAGEFKK